jgi:hypothetical protein
MPEPASGYFRYARGAAVVIPSELGSPGGTSGSLTIARVAQHLFRVEALDGVPSENNLENALPALELLAGRWQRLPHPPGGGDDGPGVAGWVRREYPGLLARPVPPKLAYSPRVRQPPPVELLGLVFPEEGPGVGETRDGWMFLCIDRTEGPQREFLFHTEVLSPNERSRRIPELDGLSSRHAVVVGAGSLGGDVSIELAKAGLGQIDLVDFDRFEATNTVRHRLSLDYTGLPKHYAVSIACQRMNPYCRVMGHEIRFGAVTWAPGESPMEQFAGLVEGADLVVDVTGSHQLAQFTSRMAAEADVPVVAAWMTDGAWGSEIVRVLPGATCCWTCFATDHRKGHLPLAERGPESRVVVQGCSQPTTSGAGFDASETAAVLTRLAVSTLAPDGGYPDLPWDYAAISFRRAPDDPKYPRFAARRLSPKEDCERCEAAVGSIGPR